MLVYQPALHPGLLLPARYRPLVEAESRADRLKWTTVGQKRHHSEHQFLWLVHPVKGGALRLAEGLLATFALVAPLGGAMDHDVSLCLASVCPAALVVAELILRVHTALLFSLTSNISKGASRPASFSTRPHPQLPVVLPPSVTKGVSLISLIPLLRFLGFLAAQPRPPQARA